MFAVAIVVAALDHARAPRCARKQYSGIRGPSGGTLGVFSNSPIKQVSGMGKTYGCDVKAVKWPNCGIIEVDEISVRF